VEVEEKYDLEIALEIITEKIAKLINDMQESESKELEKEFDYLIEQKNQIYLGNSDVIKKVVNGGL